MFTPMNADQTKRLRFEDDEVITISGDRGRRGYGLHAIVEIRGVRYEVHGRDCGSPSCVCDAYILPVTTPMTKPLETKTPPCTGMQITYRQLLAAIRRAEELKQEASNAQAHSNELYAQYRRAQKKSQGDSPTLETVDDADSAASAADAQLDEVVDWGGI